MQNVIISTEQNIDRESMLNALQELINLIDSSQKDKVLKILKANKIEREVIVHWNLTFNI